MHKLQAHMALLLVWLLPIQARAFKTVCVNTAGVWPTFEVIYHPEGCEGISITSVTKVPGQVQVLAEDSTLLYDSGPYVQDTSGMTIKVRGNTSASMLPTPYKIKLQTKADLLCRSDALNHQDKNWLLLQPRLYTMVGLYMNELMGMPFSPKCELVNVVMNDSVLGLYLLTEAVNRNPDCRVNVDKQTGYIIERDAYWWNEPVSFTTGFFPYGLQWTFKYPDAEDVTESQITTASNFVETVEASLTDSTYTRYLDVLSCAKWMVGQDALGIWDGWGSNLYFARYDTSTNSRFVVPCMWDFNTMASDEYRGRWVWAHTHHEDSYFPWLLDNIANTAFICTYCDVWEGLSNHLIEDMNAFMVPYAALFQEEYLTYKAWFAERKAYMDEQVRLMREVCTAPIPTNRAMDKLNIKMNANGQLYIVCPDGTKYNILGQRI